MKVKAIDHVVFNVRDVDASAEWYEKALDMERHVSSSDDGPIRMSMISGPNWPQQDQPSPDIRLAGGVVYRAYADLGSDDLCFLTDTPPAEVAGHFRNLGIAIETGPGIKKGARGPICSVYVRDPDDNLIKVSSYQL